MLSFAIIGTRTPDEYQVNAARSLSARISQQHTVRTGAADGIDNVAMNAALSGGLEVFLPWPSYNRDSVPFHARITVYNRSVHKDWTDSVYKYHPNPKALSSGAISLHARNYGIVAGCAGVIALPGPTGEGGTAQGIRIARALKIPVLQGNKGAVNDWEKFVELALLVMDLKGI